MLKPCCSITKMSISPFPLSSSSISSTFHENSFLHLTNTNHHQCLKPLSHTKFSLSLNLPSLHPPSSSLSSTNIGENPEDEDEDARQVVEGIAELVTNNGVPEIMSLQIASNSPQYAKMLRESVRELDELSLWNSWMKDGKLEPLNLKEKVKYIAMEKGDNGKIPYLESIGFTLPSSIHLARFLSSLSLSSLIHKVEYIKETFFSHADGDRRIGKHARRMMLHLSISIDEDIQQTLSFFEKIEARRGGLGMLKSFDTSFRYLIESFPRLLLLSVESNMKPIVKFLENVGVPRECMGDVLLLFPPLIFRDIEEEIRAGSWTFDMVGASDIKFGRMLVKYPWVLSTSVLKNYKDILAFFEAEKWGRAALPKPVSVNSFGSATPHQGQQRHEGSDTGEGDDGDLTPHLQDVPKVSVERAIRDWPLLLGCSAGKLKPMVEQLHDQGVRTTKLGKVIATSPQLLLRRPEEFQKVVTFLQDLGFGKEDIGTIIARCPELFAATSVETFQKKLEFLTSLGIAKQDFRRVIKKYPEFLASDVDRTVVPRLRYLMKSGLTEKNIASMIVRFSPLLGYSIEEVLRPKLQFLVYTIGKPVKEVVDYPRYFSYSMEKKIKPRFFLLKSRNISCNLRDMLSKNDDEFTTEFLGLERTFNSDR